MEKNLKKDICIYECMYNCIILLYTWNTANQLYFNKKIFGVWCRLEGAGKGNGALGGGEQAQEEGLVP